MKVYIIKHKGADWCGNYVHNQEIKLPDNSKIYTGRYFFKLKDAKKFLVTKDYEIVTFKNT